MVETQDRPPLVAIVTPVYNGSPFLKNTLACVQAQSYPNIIHVVLDNASTDDTPQVIAQAQGGTIPILTRRNPTVLRQVENWNAAIAMTPPEARYVKFLCADDLIRPDAIERMVAISEGHPNVDYVTAVDVFGDWIKPNDFAQEDKVYDGRECVRRLLAGDIIWFPFPHLFFRVTPEWLTAPFDAAAVPAQDADFVIRLLLQGDMGFINAPLFYTRHHEAAATNVMGGNRLFIITGLARLRRYGRDVFGSAEYEAHCRDGLLKVLRHVVAWRVSGQSKLAAQTLQMLARLDLKPGPMDYVMAIATWPLHKLRKFAQQVSQRTTEPPVRMTEVDFLRGLPASDELQPVAKTNTAGSLG